MTLLLPRRRFLTTALGLLAAPAIVRASSLMPVRPVDLAYGTPIDMPPPEVRTFKATWTIDIVEGDNGEWLINGKPVRPIIWHRGTPA